MLLEGLLEVEERDLVAVGIPVHQAVAADGNMREDETAEGDLRLDGAAGADAQDVQRAVLGELLARLEIDVGEGIELRHHDIDVVRADAGGQDRDALPVEQPRGPDEFARSALGLDGGEIGFDHGDPAGVADEDHVVGQLFRTDVDVERGAVTVDDQF